MTNIFLDIGKNKKEHKKIFKQEMYWFNLSLLSEATEFDPIAEFIGLPHLSHLTNISAGCTEPAE